jgi:hypothetical protein
LRGGEDTFPSIEPQHEERTFVNPGSDGQDVPLVVIVVDDRNRLPAYKLECHSGEYEDSSEINFSGDFQCVLFALKGGVRVSWNLLATGEPPEQSSNWLNRGRMISGQLWGKCGADREYGTVRHFRLRGMRIRFEFKDLEWRAGAEKNQHRLQKFTFSATFLPDKKARSLTAERVDSPRPLKFVQLTWSALD